MRSLFPTLAWINSLTFIAFEASSRCPYDAAMHSSLPEAFGIFDRSIALASLMTEEQFIQYR